MRLRNYLSLPCVLVEEGRTERQREMDLGYGCVLELHQVLSSFFVCSLSFSSCVYGFVMCE